MFILITGVPGTGKSTLAEELKKKLYKYKFSIINDKDFSKENKLGKECKDGEYEVGVVKLNKALSDYLSKYVNKNIIFDGHLWCEVSKALLKKFTFVFLLESSETLLRKRMKERKYLPLKIEDNVFCQTTRYIPKLLKSKKIECNLIKVNDDIKLNIKKINKFLKL